MSANTSEIPVIQSIEWLDDHVRIIDQTCLPDREVHLDLFEVGKIWEAIRTLRVRGAPAIGIITAYGVYLGLKEAPETSFDEFDESREQICNYLALSRPTAVNLQWALDRATRCIHEMKNQPVPEIKTALLELAKTIHREDKAICAAIGKNGQELVPDYARILTHCNTGSLATGQYGTALSIIYHAYLQEKNVHVWVDETRPLLQGSRLTSWELKKSGIDHHIITDSMAGWIMQRQGLDLVVVGTDRVAANGDTANKIGTYSLAVLAKHHKIPFYVAAPLSSIDRSLSSGADIPIEERSAEELRKIGQYPTAPADAPVYNPAFDITPHALITAFITEKGIIRPDFTENIALMMDGEAAG